MHHDLKIWPVFFDRIKERKKPWEIRKYDRPFDAGDTATLYEWDPTHERYTGNSVYGNIPFVMAEVMGLKEGYCAFTFDPVLIKTDDYPIAAPAPEVAPNESVSGT